MADQSKSNPTPNVDKTKTGEKPVTQGTQAGGKNPPTGGPDAFKPNQPMEGEKKGGQPGGQIARDPYPPTNPERPVMGGSPGNDPASKGAPNLGGNVGGTTPGAIAGKPGATPGLEEEEE